MQARNRHYLKPRFTGNGKQGQERRAKEWRYLVRWAYF
ncbi:tail fiber domain protein [Escherichia coli MP021552.8]|nr:tail fiber domain protein [Escherichia coli MP021552.8]